MTEATTLAPRVATRAWVMRHPTLTVPAKSVYALLDTYTNDQGTSWPSNARLMGDLRVSLRTLQRAIHELQEAGVYTSTQRGHGPLVRRLLWRPQGGHGWHPPLVTHDHQNSPASSYGEVVQNRGATGDAPVDNSPAAAPGVVQPASAAGHPRSVDALPTGPISELDTEELMALVSWSRANMPWSRNGHSHGRGTRGKGSSS